MMKYILITAIFLSNLLELSAQHTLYTPQGGDWQKEISGQYGHLDGIALFEDSTFILYGYATMVFGTYAREGEHVKFTTQKLDTMLVLAHRNPAVVGKSTMLFSGFERGVNFVQFDNERPQSVFNEHANCFDSPFIFELPAMLSQVKFFSATDPDDPKMKVWSFNNTKHRFNEFVFVHNYPKREYDDFFGGFYQDEDGRLNIQLSNYGGEMGYKRAVENVENEQWHEFVAMKQQLSQANDVDADYFINNRCAIFSAVDLSRYTYHESSNAYLKMDQEDNAAYYDQNPYDDDRVLRKLERVTLGVKTSVLLSKDQTKSGSLFYTSCEEPEKSYKSPHVVVEEYDTDAPLQITIPPVPITHRD